MKILQISFPLALLLAIGVDCNAQLRSAIVDSPQYCRNELGQIEVSYQVQSTYTNPKKNHLVIRMGLSRVLSFMLFSGRERTDPASAIYQSNQDSVESPPFRTEKLKPGQSVEWKAVATITIDDQESSSRLPKPGEYFLLAFPDMRVGGHSVSLDQSQYRGRLLPIKITKPDFDPPLCDSPK
jgi:hypothetical protein